MPRPRKAKISDEFRLQMALQYHVIDARISVHDGVTELKHETYGWMDMEQFYTLQKLHDLEPYLIEVIRGGYRAKAWLWSISIGVLGVDIPVGGSLPVVEAWNVLQELQRVPLDPVMLAVRLYALLGPWGDVIQIMDSLYGLENIQWPGSAGPYPIPVGPRPVGPLPGPFRP